MAVSSFQTSPGTRDILPPHAGRWRAMVQVFADGVEAAGYQNIIPPMFEDLGVFQRLGDATDVVTKEMYDFVDKGGRHIALRPEHTASVCRAFAQHRPTPPWKVWYSGPNFRYERPQAGRYRQFDQVGIEVLGVDDSQLDVEVISLGWDFYKSIGLSKVSLIINSLGDAGDRGRYVDALGAYFKTHSDTLSAEALATLERNPLRVLDSKRPQDAPAIATAPTIGAFLSTDAAAHFAAVCAGLDTLNIPYVVNDRLVRGLDYYQRTTFEFVSGSLDSAQNAVGGGGRYDGLVEDLGGPATPGIGFALGVDRTLLACDAEECFSYGFPVLDVFVIDTTGGGHALSLTHQLRQSGYSADRAFEARSMKSQMKSADRSGAQVAVIIGESESEQSTCSVRNLSTSEQTTIPLIDLQSHLASILGPRQPRRHTP
ncbi:MAG: histidine--tRNA ligase [Actinobacteria bacterium]|nr:histidine--tRNA ligase [Actinomycetota bacterium]MSZ59978.1 histidine--tRNA ligase [Actinomycetota bacterium]MTB11789.1 histidine--tRNA ligase [Actinomycetota bacterium]